MTVDEVLEVSRLLDADPAPDAATLMRAKSMLDEAFLAENAQGSMREHSTRSPSPRVVALVAAAVVIVATVGLTLGLSRPSVTRSSHQVTHSPTGALAGSWHLTAALIGPQFKVATNAPNAIVGVVCNAGPTCFLSTGYGLDYPGGGGMYVSHDGGHSWTSSLIPTGVATTTLASCASATWCAAGAGLLDRAAGDVRGGKPGRDPALMITTNAGASWSTVPVPIPIGVERIPAIAPYPASTDYWPGGVDAVSCSAPGVCTVLGQMVVNAPSGRIADRLIVFHTADGGIHWTKVVLRERSSEGRDQVSMGPGDSESMSCPTPRTCVVVASLAPASSAEGPVVEVWRTINAGVSWTEHRVPGAIVISSKVSCADSKNCWMLTIRSARYPNGAVLHSSDGGTSWTPFTKIYVGSNRLNTIDEWSSLSCVSAATCYLGGSGLAETTDGGATWNRVALPEDIYEVTSISCDPKQGCAALANPAKSNGAIIENEGSLVLTDNPSRRP
jgi:hypothetical protein